MIQGMFVTTETHTLRPNLCLAQMHSQQPKSAHLNASNAKEMPTVSFQELTVITITNAAPAAAIRRTISEITVSGSSTSSTALLMMTASTVSTVTLVSQIFVLKCEGETSLAPQVKTSARLAITVLQLQELPVFVWRSFL